MIEKYRWFFDVYLRACKGLYDPEKPYENLEKCIKFCNSSCWELIGMLRLLNVTGEIDDAAYEAEKRRVFDSFSSFDICNAYMEDGEVMIFAKRSDNYAGCSTTS